MELDESLEINKKQRLDFVRFWAKYVKEHKNEVWSSQQAKFINSVLRSSNTDPKLYLKIKNIVSNK